MCGGGLSGQLQARRNLPSVRSAHAVLARPPRSDPINYCLRHVPREWMSDHDVELLTAGELLVRLAEQFPDKVRAAHERTVRYSPKSENEILVTLEAIVRTRTADTLRRLATARR